MKTRTQYRDPVELKALAIGDKVAVQRDDGSLLITTLRTPPWQLGHGEWVVGVEGEEGDVTNFCEMKGSFEGFLCHATALDGAGYAIAGGSDVN